MNGLELVRRAAGLPVDGEERAATLKEPSDWLWEALGASATASGQGVSVDSALGLIPVFSAVRLLANSVGSLPCIVYRAGAGGGRERARDSRQWLLVHTRPNPVMAPDLFFETVTGHLNLWGNAYLEKVKGAGVVGEMWPLAPRDVRVERDAAGRKRFRVAGNDGTFDEGTILHIPAFGYDGAAGLSPIAQCRAALGVAQAREEYEGRFYANDATPGGFISHPGTLSNEAALRLRSSWDAAHQGVANARRTAVLEEGMVWQTQGIPLEDQQFIEGHRFSVGQIARLFRVPPEMIGGDSGSSLTYSTVEGQALHFVKFSLTHWLVRIEKALHHDDDLFPDKALYPEFLVEGLLRGDSTSRAAFYEVMKRIGVLNSNEIRERENLPPREGGDVYQETSPGAPANPPAAGAPEPAGRSAQGNGHGERALALAALAGQPVEVEVRQEAMTFNLPAPVVNVSVEPTPVTVNVDPTPVTVAAPTVNVEPTPVNVANEVTVEQGRRRVAFERDADGRVSGATIAEGS